MTKSKYIILVIVLVALVGGAIVLATNSDKDNDSDGKTNTASQSTTTESTSNQDTAAQTTGEVTTITYGDNGFSPSMITVKSGTTVTIKNESSHGLQFDSDPHPAHTDDEELNVNSVPNGSSETFVVKRTGTFGYHNHLNPSDTGTIVVQ